MGTFALGGTDVHGPFFLLPMTQLFYCWPRGGDNRRECTKRVGVDGPWRLIAKGEVWASGPADNLARPKLPQCPRFTQNSE